MPSELAFSVSQQIQPPNPVDLGRFLASQYERIRVLAFCPSDAVGDVELVISHLEGGSAPGWLDRLLLIPGTNVNQVYEAPGVTLGVSAAAAGEAQSRVNVWIWGFRAGQGIYGPSPGGSSPVAGGDGDEDGAGPVEVFLPDDALTLSGVSPTAFNSTDAQLTFNLADAQFWQDTSAETALRVNDQVVPDTKMTITANSITATEVLIPHRNVIHLVSADSGGRSLHFHETIWAGTNALQVNLRNPDDTPFLEQATSGSASPMTRRSMQRRPRTLGSPSLPTCRGPPFLFRQPPPKTAWAPPGDWLRRHPDHDPHGAEQPDHRE